MSLKLRRREFFEAGLAGLGTLAAPRYLLAATLGRGFTHGIASGEPSSTGMLLWTRYVGTGGETTLAAEIAEDAEFGRIAGRAEAAASPATDHCAKVRVDGLEPGRWYYYRFRGPAGAVSPTGRTRTLPAGNGRFRMAVFSCSNLPFGWFNAYAHAAKADDCDLVVHLGDYIYEYRAGTYPDAAQALPQRRLEPKSEAVSLADYRRRYAVYRADPDLSRLHRLFPMVAAWDDHEFANDAWKGGAENHQPATEGDWELRKAAARAAYRDWLPVSNAPYARYEIGDLATLFRLDTRIEGRDRQIDVGAVLRGAADPQSALAALRSGAWSDPARTMLGRAQEDWLARALAASTAAGKRWQVLAQQVLMGYAYAPPDIVQALSPGVPAAVRTLVQTAILMSAAGLPSNMDAWAGYPAARARLLGAAQQAGANLVVLAGDSHNGWAFELSEGGAPAGVEFGGSSVTSPGYEAYFSADPARLARRVVAASPELRWADTSRRGYMHVTLTPDEARCEWRLLDTVRQRSTALAGSARMSTRHGTNRLAET